MTERDRSRSWTGWSLVALAATGSLFAQDSKKTPPPPPQPSPNVVPPPAKKLGDPTNRQNGVSNESMKIIEGLATNKEAEAARHREALLVFQQALAAHQGNRPADAIRLGRRAKQLFPANQEIANFVAQVQRESGAGKLASPSTTKAKAYLAAGYSRGLELMRNGRTAQGEDLLLGVVEASRLFPDPTHVDYYRRLAESELAQFRLTQANGTQPPPAPASNNAAAPPPNPEPPRNVVIMPPDNTRRLIRTPEARVPPWYVQAKNRLATSMTVDYRGTSAALVLDDIAAKTGVEFVIDRPVALARSHINSVVDFRAGDVPAEFILDLVCQKAGFEYVVMEKSIVLTTRSKALEYLRLLPEALRNNWLVARTLFPETALDLIAAEAGPTPAPPTPADVATASRHRPLEGEVQAHLQSGRALVAAIQALLK